MSFDLQKYGIDDMKNTYEGPERFKYMMRNSLIEWSIFAEQLNESFDYDFVIKKVSDLLDIRNANLVHTPFINILKAIYHLEPEQHIYCMIKQFTIFESKSMSIFLLFNVMKHHFEYIIVKFLHLRNEYAARAKRAINDIEKLKDKWEEINSGMDDPTSSTVLYFFNKESEDGSYDKIEWEFGATEEQKSLSKELQEAIQNFKYEGFCHKQAGARLVSLLKFPLRIFLKAILSLDSSFELADYDKIAEEIKTIVKEKVPRPEIKVDYTLPEEPNDLLAAYEEADKQQKTNIENHEFARLKLKLIRWYMDNIMVIRKRMLPYCEMYEKYYLNSAEIIDKIYHVAERYLSTQLEY